MPTAPRLLLYAAAALGGAAAGLLGSFVHPLRLVGLPVGLVLGLGLSAAAFAAARAATAGRAGVGVAALGWAVPVLALSAPRPEGDLVIPATGLGYAWLLGGLALAAAAVARRPGPGPSADGAARR